MKLEKILLPVDFSERSAGAAHIAATLAKRFGSTIDVLHVCAAPDYYLAAPEYTGSLSSEWNAAQKQESEKKIRQLIDAELSGLQTKAVTLEGSAAEEIIEYAKRESCSVIVMPTHGYGRFRRFILGSVAAKVLHDAECPVLTGIHMEEVPSNVRLDIRKILCAIDLKAHSGTVLAAADIVAREFKATMKLVHVLPIVDSPETVYFDQDWKTAITKQANKEVEELQQACGTSHEVLMKPGEAAKAIDQVAREEKADLLVIGRSEGQSVIGRLRTQAYAIIRDSPCPVLSV